MGELTDKIKGAANKAAGSVKAKVGEMTDNPKLEAEGELQKAKGEVQSAVGTVKGKLGDKI